MHDLFILTPVAGQTPKDLQYVNVPKGLPQLVDRRFTRFMARFDVGVIPPTTMKIHVELAEKMICFFWVQKTDVEIAMNRAF